jgi:hypothetical protein
MSPDFIEATIRAIVDTYGAEHVSVARESGRTMVRISSVELYDGCKPASTPMMLLFDSSQAKPMCYVQPGQLLSNGRAPRSTSIAMVGGESWLQFSFNIPWEETHGITRFIAAARQRFVQND